MSGCSPGLSVPEESTTTPPSASVAGSSVSHGTPPCPQCCCLFVSWVLETPASPAAVLRSSIKRGEWVPAWALCPRREHSPSPLSFCGRVFSVPRDPSLLPLLLPFVLLGPGNTSYPCCSAEEFYPESAEEFYPESAEEFYLESAEEFHPERRRWAGANARIPPTT